MLPSPAELTYFTEVANCQNLSRASRKLGVSQPSLSLAVKRLEHTLGIELFIRHKQGVSLTPAGEQLLKQVKPLLQHWENTKIQARASHHEVQGRVTIGCRSATALYMGSFLRELLVQHPQLEINYKFQNSQKTTEGVINSAIDIGLVANPVRHNDLVIQQLGDIEVSFWVGQGECGLQDIHSGNAVMICEPHAPLAQALLKKLEKDNRKIARVINANSLEVIAHLTIEGCGIGVLPTCFAEKSYPGKLKRVAALPSQTSEFCLIYRHENKNVEAIRTVIAALKELAVKKD